MFENFTMRLEKKHFFILPLFAGMAYISQELVFFCERTQKYRRYNW